MDVIDIVVRILIPAIAAIILGAIFSHTLSSNDKELLENLRKENVVVHLPKAYVWVGCADVSFFSACLLLMRKDTEVFKDGDSLWIRLLFSAFILLGVIIIIATLTWKVYVYRNENYFVYRTVFGRKHKIQYEQCESYKYGTNTLVLRALWKKFFIDNKATNFEFFLAMLTKHGVKEC